MRISIFGLGYVGAVTAACLARDGHRVLGVDVSEDKVATLNAGRSPIVEPDLDSLLSGACRAGMLRATTDGAAAVAETEASFISVGTPSQPNGAPDLSYVENVCQEIGRASATKATSHTVILRSTVPPGTTDHCRELLAQAAGGRPIDIAFNPEFLREGSAIADYDHPPYTVIGTSSPAAAAVARHVYATLAAPVFVVEPAVAELVKYVANAWHATKVVFANEIGRLARSSGIDGREVMGIMTRDTKLNISDAYLRPGFAYGGSCLPKDVIALLAQARHSDVPVPLLSALPISNTQQIDAAFSQVTRSGRRRIAVIGLAFKAATDDLRESPTVVLVKRLIGDGYEVGIYAPDVSRARLMGTNLEYVHAHLPHFEGLLTDELEDLLEWCEIAVVAQNDERLRRAGGSSLSGRIVVDLAGAFESPPAGSEYHGIAW